MSALLWTVGVILAAAATFAGYVYVGVRFARHTAQRDAVEAQNSYPGGYAAPYRRDNYRARQAVSVWLWPFKAIHVATARGVQWEDVDPEIVARRERETERRIADLERQLGIQQRVAS